MFGVTNVLFSAVAISQSAWSTLLNNISLTILLSNISRDCSSFSVLNSTESTESIEFVKDYF